MTRVPLANSLLEILVVIALISLLTSGVAVGALQMVERVKKRRSSPDLHLCSFGNKSGFAKAPEVTG